MSVTSIACRIFRNAAGNSRSLSTMGSSSVAARPTAWRPWGTIMAVTGASLVAGTVGAIYPPTTLSILFPRSAPPPLAPDTPEAVAYTSSLEETLQKLPLLKELRERGDAAEWYETRPYQGFPEERRVNNLTAGALRGPGKLALPPLILVKKDESESIVFLHLGRGLCGHDGIVHGGLLATVLDETLARTAILNLPDKVGVTARLTLNYKAPTAADQIVVIRTRIEELKERKAVVSGRIEDLNGRLLVEASGTFVQPRYAKLLQSAQLTKTMGEPPAMVVEAIHIDGQDISSKRKNL